MKPCHLAWLGAHPHRHETWLADKFKDGDDIHHLNRDHDNTDPAILVLIEHTDHMMLHGGRTMARLKGRPQKKKSAEEPTEALARRNRRKLYKKIAGRWKLAA